MKVHASFALRICSYTQWVAKLINTISEKKDSLHITVSYYSHRLVTCWHRQANSSNFLSAPQAMQHKSSLGEKAYSQKFYFISLIFRCCRRLMPKPQPLEQMTAIMKQ